MLGLAVDQIYYQQTYVLLCKKKLDLSLLLLRMI